MHNISMCLLAVGAILVAGTARAEPPTVAVAAFDYQDTSGEARDLSADHARRLAIIQSAVVARLAKSGGVVIPLSCHAADCSVGALGSDRIIAAARAQGAHDLVYGGIHKSSTLVEWIKVEIVDLQSRRLRASKLLTFRGDTDEAYCRAGNFAASEVAP